jgi:hypothetical protein
MEDVNRYWYCIACDGKLYILGDHGDFESAEEKAEDMGLEAVWLFDQTTADEWRETLTSVKAQFSEG